MRLIDLMSCRVSHVKQLVLIHVAAMYKAASLTTASYQYIAVLSCIGHRHTYYICAR